jgi:hypothetical protein
MDLEGSGWIWMDLVGSGWIWMDLVRSGWILANLDESEWILTDLVDGYLVGVDGTCQAGRRRLKGKPEATVSHTY